MKMADKTKLLVRNIGLMLSGRLEQPILDADCILAVDGKIAAIGREKDVDAEGAGTVVDAKGIALAPGLIDSHVHPVIGDYTPRQQQLSWIDSCLHGGVTTMISAGEVHLPGRPKDIVGLKALAIASQLAGKRRRPGPSCPAAARVATLSRAWSCTVSPATKACGQIARLSSLSRSS